MAIVVFDNFNGTNGIDLDAHSPDIDVVGSGWNQSGPNEVELDGSGAVKFASAADGAVDAHDTALRLKSPSQTISINAQSTYEATLNYVNGTTVTFAASIEDGVPTITPERDTWLRDTNGNLLFDVNKQLLEVANENWLYDANVNLLFDSNEQLLEVAP